MSGFLINTQIQSSLPIGDFITIPFRNTFFAVENAGTGSTGYVYSVISDNDDGTSSGLNASVPSGSTGSLGSWSTNATRIRFPFYGRAFGLRCRRDNLAGTFSVAIDGVSYGLFDARHTHLVNEGVTGLNDGQGVIMIDTNLPDGLHYAEIVLSPPATGNNIVKFFGYIVEKRGYSEQPRRQTIVSTVAVGTSQSNMPIIDSNYTQRGIRKLVFTNTTATAITVNIYNGGTLMWSKSIAGNDSTEFDFGGLTAFNSGSSGNSNLTYNASATGVNMTTIGGY